MVEPDRLTGEERHQRVEVLAHVARRRGVTQTPEPFDHDLVRQPDPEVQPAPGRRLDGERLLREHLGVTPVDRDHAGAELDALDLGADRGEHSEGVVAKDLRGPDTGEPQIGTRLRLIHQMAERSIDVEQ
jgi:hypothetical protein